MRLFVTIFLMFALAGGAVFFAVPTVKEYRRSKAIDKEISELQREARKINEDNNFLREKINYLKSDEYKKRIAKDRLNLRNPGEKVVIIQPKQGIKNVLAETDNKKNISENDNSKYFVNVKKWYRFVFKNKNN